MPRHSVTITEKFRAAVEAYRRQRGLPSWSSAIVELAAAALGYQEQAVGSWGGDRKTVIPDPDAPFPETDPWDELGVYRTLSNKEK